MDKFIGTPELVLGTETKSLFLSISSYFRRIIIPYKKSAIYLAATVFCNGTKWVNKKPKHDHWQMGSHEKPHSRTCAGLYTHAPSYCMTVAEDNALWWMGSSICPVSLWGVPELAQALNFVIPTFFAIGGLFHSFWSPAAFISEQKAVCFLTSDQFKFLGLAVCNNLSVTACRCGCQWINVQACRLGHRRHVNSLTPASGCWHWKVIAHLQPRSLLVLVHPTHFHQHRWSSAPSLFLLF